MKESVSDNPLRANRSYELAGFPVERVGFGAMQLPGRGVLGPPRDHDEAVAVLRRAVELGANHIDTAQYYGPEVANELIREALHPYPDDLVLVSKVGAERDGAGKWLPAQRPEQLRRGVEDNLRTLRVEQLAAVNLRLLDAGHAPPDDPPLEAKLESMVALREEGKIAGVGISNATLDQVRTAMELAGIACVQNAFSLADQSDSRVVELCLSAGIAYVPFFPLGSAFAGLPKVTDRPGVREVAKRRGRSPAQIGLAWLLARSENILLIPGTSSLAHLEENMAVEDVRLSADDLLTLDG